MFSNGTFHPITVDSTNQLESLFADCLFQALRDEELLTQETIDSMKSWEHSGFHVFVGELVEPDDTEQQLFLARYLKRNPVALERLSILEDGPEPVVRVIKSIDEPEVYQDYALLIFSPSSVSTSLTPGSKPLDTSASIQQELEVPLIQSKNENNCSNNFLIPMGILYQHRNRPHRLLLPPWHPNLLLLALNNQSLNYRFSTF